MKSSMLFTSIFNSPAVRRLAVRAATVVAKLRDLAPYAAIELILPGGSLMALLLWFYRRQNKDRAAKLFERVRGRWLRLAADTGVH